MKTYITEEQLTKIDETIKLLITDKLLIKLKELKKKYGIEFYYDRQTNMNLFWKMVIDEIDNLPNTNHYKQSLIASNLWDINKNRNDVILKYMVIKGYETDYKFLQQWQTTDLEFFIEWELQRKYLLPRISIADLLRMDNYKKHFQQYTKKYCDKEALDYTTKVLSHIDSLYTGLTREEQFKLLAIIGQYTHNPEMTFDQIHYELHKN